VGKIKRLGRRKTAEQPVDLSSHYNLTPEQALSLPVPPKATPFVDRPPRMHEWGVAPTSEGPTVLESEVPEVASGQGEFIFGQQDKWKDTIDPANLPKADSGTAEQRREVAGRLGGLKSERKRPNTLKELVRHISYKSAWAPPTEVRNPAHVKDMIAESGIPPEHLTYLEEMGTTIKENTRKLSLMDKFRDSDRPRDFYTSVDKKLEPGSEIGLTSQSGFHSGAGYFASALGAGTTTPKDTVAHESGHAMHDFVSRVADGPHGFWYEGPRAVGGEQPHKEGVADAYREMYTEPSGPTDPMDPDRATGYGIYSAKWEKDDPVLKHDYETTRLQTMGGSTERGYVSLGPGLDTIEPSSMGQRPVMGTLERLLSPDSDYVRTMYGTRKFEGGADLVPAGREAPFDFEGNTDYGTDYDDTSWTDKGVRWKTAGRDYTDDVLSKVQVGPAPQAGDEGTFDHRGVQQSMFPEIAPHVDLRENVRHGTEENQRSGEDHLNRVKSNLKTWLV